MYNSNNKIMEVTEKVFEIMPLQSGIGQRTGNEWKSQELVLITNERYPKKMAFIFNNSFVNKLTLVEPNDTVTVSFDIESNKVGDRYYSSLRAWDCKIVRKNNTVPATNTPDPVGECNGTF